MNTLMLARDGEVLGRLKVRRLRVKQVIDLPDDIVMGVLQVLRIKVVSPKNLFEEGLSRKWKLSSDVDHRCVDGVSE